MRNTSLTLLYAEACLLAPLSIVGVTVSLISLRSVPSALVLLGLISGWRVAFALLMSGRRVARTVSLCWWIAAALVAGAAIFAAAFPHVAASLFGPHDEPDWAAGFPVLSLAAGIFFVPSFLHLAAETWLRSA
jgi:hypothetical protein